MMNNTTTDSERWALRKPGALAAALCLGVLMSCGAADSADGAAASKGEQSKEEATVSATAGAAAPSPEESNAPMEQRLLSKGVPAPSVGWNAGEMAADGDMEAEEDEDAVVEESEQKVPVSEKAASGRKDAEAGKRLRANVPSQDNKPVKRDDVFGGKSRLKLLEDQGGEGQVDDAGEGLLLGRGSGGLGSLSGLSANGLKDDGKFETTTLNKAKSKQEVDRRVPETDKAQLTTKLKAQAGERVSTRGDFWRQPTVGKNRAVQPLPDVYKRPARMLPRMFYFEPTYLGGNAGVAERLRRLKAHLPDAQSRILDAARSHPQDFDAPESTGMALTARLSTPWIDKPQRVLLQVGLQGSRRYGWRRPPLDVVLVLDAPLMRGTMRTARGLIRAAMRRLGAQDRVGVVTVGAQGGPTVVAPVQRIRDLELGLERALSDLQASSGNPHPSNALAMAGDLLKDASADAAQVPGTQTVWLLTAGSGKRRIRAASQAADALTRRGIVTSVVEVGAALGSTGDWWTVASSGHGNYHRPPVERTASAFDDELENLSRVVARLLRVNVRLADGVGAIRVVGSRVLDPDEVRRLKAREKAVDSALSKTMGLAADRGEDDDGVQTNIPYFYGGDSHVILVELWVERPGSVVDVTIKYKDMVNLKNATARVSVAMAGTPERAVGLESLTNNLNLFRVAETLIKAGYKVKHRRFTDARRLLETAASQASGPQERELVAGFQRWLSRAEAAGRDDALSEALILAGRRQIGQPPSVAEAPGAQR